MAWVVCVLLAAVCVLLAVKLYLMRKSCDEIIEKLDLIMKEDTNANVTVV